MNIRQIEAFRYIMMTGTTARAAETMHTSQPAVSRLLAQLESNLRMRLFEREKSRLRPTPEAKRLLVEVDRAFAGMAQIRERAEWIRSGAGGSLFVACLPALGFGAMPQIVARFRKEFPDMAVRLEVHSSSEVRDRVASGRCDLGFAADEIDTTGVIVHPTAERPAQLALPANHPLCRYKSVRIELLCRYPFIALSQTDSVRRQLDALLRAKELELQIAVETAYSLTVANLVKCGAGIGLVNPLALTEQDAKGLELRRIDHSIVFKTLALSSAASPLSTPALRLLEFVREAVGRI
ncbi:MAG: LysR family transcriptional regulator [Rudaea sp.]|uniref:LysR family transcriptional regulator n=1 Tax=unclassified Rudaea TaxID=2627037 RepID=UPI0010F840DC|nr:MULTISPECIES: LysR family transcriptional regulator [unclassified Rudaea]MBN8888487.1 LysR family transcriptional regulator [Rudaea sp.]MBR0345260.1 LysR family transcriptional regulator [Rudaea sp.]